MKALTQCWFTRIHQPMGRAAKDDDGTQSSRCRHCERAIVSWDRARWFLADGFNVTHLAETVGGRFLFVLDRAEEVVIASYPVHQLAGETDIEALRQDLITRHGIAEHGSGLELHDSGSPRRKPGRIRRAAMLPQGIGVPASL